MARSIKSQFMYCINQCFQSGVKKKTFKEQNGSEMSDKIFSYNEKYRLLDVAKNLQNFLKSKEKDIKFIKEISPEDIQDFLNSKRSTCTQTTINSYAQSLYKLQNAAESVFGIKLSWREKIVVPEAYTKSDERRGSGHQIPKKDYEKILEYCQKSKYSQSNMAILIQNHLGIRVEELARIKLKNIDLSNKSLLIKGKGGKLLTRDISECMDLFREVINKEHNKEFIFTIEGRSINKQLQRISKKLGMDSYSNHNIRAYIAQRYFDGCRARGMEVADSLADTSRWLNHVTPRQQMMTKSYINLH